MSETVHILHTAPEDRRFIHESEVAKNQQILESGWLKLVGKSLIDGSFPKRPSEMRQEAESNIEYQHKASKRYREENLPALEVLAEADMEADFAKRREAERRMTPTRD